MNSIFLKISLIFLSALIVSGCLDSRQSEVVEWMVREKSQIVPQIKPLQPSSVFTPSKYEYQGAEDPFSVAKLARVFSGVTVSANGKKRIDENRRKEPLEEYPLDNIKMVGFLEKDKRPTALLHVEGSLYQVIEGNYLGQNYGKIEKITESRLELQEMVQDAAGDWVERSTILELQE